VGQSFRLNPAERPPPRPSPRKRERESIARVASGDFEPRTMSKTWIGQLVKVAASGSVSSLSRLRGRAGAGVLPRLQTGWIPDRLDRNESPTAFNMHRRERARDALWSPVGSKPVRTAIEDRCRPVSRETPTRSPQPSSALPHAGDRPPRYPAQPASNHPGDPPAPPSAAAPLPALSAPRWRGRAHRHNRHR
jgi:hypothetical protein